MSSEDPEVTCAPARIEPLTVVPEPEKQMRPVGVSAIACLFAVACATALLFAILIVLEAVPLSYGAFLLPNGLEQAGPVGFIVYAVVTGGLALGLWNGANWARRLVVLVAIAGIVFVVPGISSAVVDSRVLAIAGNGLQIIVRVAIVFYLSQEPVKDWFASPK